ncbi:hypothetical protein HY732_00930 [Candidatus Uhrbacteria bacterium]|nr:hypothetical protein [Elusimicrobiota bacterium]MBI4599468.1 hypothetical protein [Candidatus Uhrbacteria bacterium]
MHCHDTHGTALDCVATGLEYGIRSFDSSIGGLGGCPFAPGAPGNLATEDLVFFLEKKGVDCGLSGKNLLDIFDASRTGDLVNQSKTWKALTGKKRKI